MKLLAPAKINLNLSIAGRREKDGYHLLESKMVFTNWGDDITITSADEFRLTAEGPYSNIFTGALLATNRGAPNLIVRATYLMADKAKRNPDIHIHVGKNIPAGAGLGGGSSDAACVMRALNDMWDMGLTIDELCAMGLTLGAELPACIHGRPCRVTGIGDIITPIESEEKFIVITWPDHPLLTKDVFEAYAQSPVTGQVNDLTQAAQKLCSEIEISIQQLNGFNGCESAFMSGSGSACFGIFKTLELAEAASCHFENAIATTTRTQF